MPKEKLFEKFTSPLIIIAIFFTIVSFTEPAKTKTSVPTNNQLKISFLNVGQGDATYLETKNINVLIDGGPDKKVLEEIPKVQHNLNKNINYVFLTHAHADHLSGLNYLLGRYNIGKIFYNGFKYQSPDFEFFLRKTTELNLPLERVRAGSSYKSEDLNLNVLWPYSDSSFKNLNDSSIVILATYKTKKFLFLGDLSAPMQEKIVKDYELPDIDIMKVGHHGSKNGLSKALLDETKPEYAVISVGKNSYGHPSPQTLSLLTNIKVLRTDQLGTINFISDGKELLLVR